MDSLKVGKGKAERRKEKVGQFESWKGESWKGESWKVGQQKNKLAEKTKAREKIQTVSDGAGKLVLF